MGIGFDDWLTGEIGIAKAKSRRQEIDAIIKSLEYAGNEISYSNFDNGNIAKAIKLLRLLRRGVPLPD